MFKFRKIRLSSSEPLWLKFMDSVSAVFDEDTDQKIAMVPRVENVMKHHTLLQRKVAHQSNA